MRREYSISCFSYVLYLCTAIHLLVASVWNIKELPYCSIRDIITVLFDPSPPGKQCMGLVDLDRSWAAETHGYSVKVMTMEPDSCSPKNNMLVGVAGGGAGGGAGGDNYAAQ